MLNSHWYADVDDDAHIAIYYMHFAWELAVCYILSLVQYVRMQLSGIKSLKLERIWRDAELMGGLWKNLRSIGVWMMSVGAWQWINCDSSINAESSGFPEFRPMASERKWYIPI